MLQNETDEEIILLYEKGNKEAFKMLINRYTSPIYNFVAHLTNKNDANDIVQDVFMKTWKHLSRFNPSKASFKTWIFTIARNTATDFLRKSGSTSGGKKIINFSDMENSARQDLAEDTFAENIPADDLLPNEVLQKLEDTETLNKISEKLSLNYREILTLHYQEELTFEEIGKILNKPLNTVKSMHHRAIIELRKMLNP